jgi:hypothetical protein
VNVLAASFGSAGDFLPTLAIASALRKRGHGVSLIANPFFEPHARRAGVAFLSAGAYCDMSAEFESNPRYLTSLGGGYSVWKDFVIPNIVATHAAARGAIAAKRPHLLLCNDMSFGAVWAAAEKKIRHALVSASPLVWVNPRAPMIVSDWVPPRWLQRQIGHIAGVAASEFFTHSLRPVARRMGTISDASFRSFIRDAALLLGMWSPSIRSALSGDPPASTVCGFARAGHFGGETCSPEVEAFLAKGPPPVVVGLGSAHAFTAGPLLRAVAEACDRAGLRCLIAGCPASESNFGRAVLAVRYEPYHLVFPRAAVVVIHGGAGATSEALRSGRPVLALPFAFDQFLMANQVERAGAGIWLRKRQRSCREITNALLRLVSRENFARRAEALASTLACERDGALVAAELIESHPLTS